MSVLDRLKGAVVGRSKVDPMGWAIEIDQQQFNEIISELYALEDARKRLGELTRTIDGQIDQIEQLYADLSGMQSLSIEVLEVRDNMYYARQLEKVVPEGHNQYKVFIRPDD